MSTHEFVKMVAEMTSEGELVEGSPFEPTMEDSFATVNRLIDEARTISRRGDSLQGEAQYLGKRVNKLEGQRDALVLALGAVMQAHVQLLRDRVDRHITEDSVQTVPFKMARAALKEVGKEAKVPA